MEFRSSQNTWHPHTSLRTHCKINQIDSLLHCMYWPFGATVCMWAILSQSYFYCMMICRFQWERMLLQTAEVALIQMSHIQVLAPKGQHIQKAKIWTFECTKNPMEKTRILSLLLIIVWQYVTTWINVFFWNVQNTNETLWRWKKFLLSLPSQTCRNCVWGQLIWGRY